MIESVLIGGAGGALGVVTAYFLTDLVIALAPAGIPRIEEVTLNGPVLAFALGVTAAATLVSGLWPALRSTRAGFAGSVGGMSRAAVGRGSSRVVSHALIAAEMTLAVVVTLGSGLMLRSMNELLSVDLGFDAAGVVAFRPNPLGSGREGGEAFRQFYGELLDQMATVPGVQEAGAVQILTGTPNNWSFPTYPEGYVIPESGAMPDVNFRAVMPGYFETLGIPLLRGRTIDSEDRADTEPVVVVNRAFAERFWPGETPIGKNGELVLDHGVNGSVWSASSATSGSTRFTSILCPSSTFRSWHGPGRCPPGSSHARTIRRC